MFLGDKLTAWGPGASWEVFLMISFVCKLVGERERVLLGEEGAGDLHDGLRLTVCWGGAEFEVAPLASARDLGAEARF